jgi:hypothetical protein
VSDIPKDAVILPSPFYCLRHFHEVIPKEAAGWRVQMIVWGTVLFQGVTCDERFWKRCGKTEAERTPESMNQQLGIIGHLCCFLDPEARQLAKHMVLNRQDYGPGGAGTLAGWQEFYRRRGEK